MAIQIMEPSSKDDNAAYVSAAQYYTTGDNAARNRTRAYTRPEIGSKYEIETVLRRASHEDKGKARKFLINVEDTRKLLLEREDTDNDFQITVNDIGPKTLALGTADSGGFRKIGIRGNYMLSNLLQELALADDYGRKYIVLDEDRLCENPVNRLSRMIRHTFWDGLTRCIDADGLNTICADTKDRTGENRPRIYIPYGEQRMYDYYKETARTRPHLHDLQVEFLPKNITAEYVRDINTRPGILALNMVEGDDGQLKGCPFVVPGGRFNEMYGWDSYFEVLGLLADNRVAMAKSMTDNFAFEIKHYGKILNANRSYYLCRSQPPFLTDMALRIYDKMDTIYPGKEKENKEWLRSILQSAIKEYHQVWMSSPRLDPKTMLSRYRPDGLGIPPETEASHFDHIIERYSKPLGLPIPEYDYLYTQGKIREPELDEYFLHDRAVRESGHDTTYRFEGVCANLATIDLNSLLYRYEVDLATAIDNILDGELVDMDTGERQTSNIWYDRARQRKERINTYLWNAENSLYYDYDTVKEKQTTYESATAFWALWAGCASADQADALATNSLFKFETKGGLVSGTENSRGKISLSRPNRQWDFPFGWAPHQILAWEGFEKYGMKSISERLAYRWLYTITKAFVEFNGVVPEKFDVVAMSHKVEVEYGNQGTDFKYVPREGFGWMNSSYEVGLLYLKTSLVRALGTLTDPDDLFAKSLQYEQENRSPDVQVQADMRRRASTIAARHFAHSHDPDATEAATTKIYAEAVDDHQYAHSLSPEPQFLDVDYSQPHISPSQENLDLQLLAP
ncbi:trehalase-domain-containing protein [Halteromyces radiatus]|uniref:trehalase-domain-containing protein n=1 Tax=Halteromyces radiatus TaxID=101107 RepID=UPI00221F1696|nr:trehalase-domain-containing protein [Halteromyces radiatus]KAI8084796.1 trehalase-domain-containing protein [Halteromyces radiatus]